MHSYRSSKEIRRTEQTFIKSTEPLWQQSHCAVLRLRLCFSCIESYTTSYATLLIQIGGEGFQTM